MENTEMITKFLSYMYSKNYLDQDPSLDEVDKWVKTTGIERTAFWKNYESMIKIDLIKFVQDDAVLRLTPKGTLFAEKSGLVSQEMILRNRAARKKLMTAMSTCLTTCGARIGIKQLVDEVKLAKGEIYGNLELLISMGYAKWEVPGERISISPRVFAKATAVSKAA